MTFIVGEKVTRRSYGNDVLFTITKVVGEVAILHGEEIRLVADAPVTDLERIEERALSKRRKKDKERAESSFKLFRQDYHLMRQKRLYEQTGGFRDDVEFFHLPVQVLHFDGDANYLKKCLALYERLGVEAEGVHLNEKEMPHQVEEYLRKFNPNCLVITGHDSYASSKGKDRGYRNSQYFADAVRNARKVQPNLDQLVIFAGACQSYFELLIRAGANFASSPERVNIHALDPVYIISKIAYTSFSEKVGIYDVIRNTYTGLRGIGGVETKGLLRTGLPYKINKEVTIDEGKI